MKLATRKQADLITVGLALSMVCGCIPEKRVVWTHDGSVAAVVSDKGFFLINGDGKVLPGRAELSAVRAAWSRDGKRLLGVHRTESESWSDIESVMSEAQRKLVVEKSKIAKPRMMAYTGDWKDFEILPERNIPGGLLVAIVLYLRDNDAEGLPEKLGDKWRELSEVKPTIWHLQTFDRDGDKLKSGRVLVRSLDEIIFPTASPDDKYVAYNSDSWGESGMGRSLFVVSADGGAVRVPAVNVAAGFDWSPDGQRLAYVRSSLIQNGIDEYLQLGSLATIRIRGDDGALLKEWETLEDRAGLLFNPFTCIKWLSDGRILFASVEMTLPATKHDMPRRWSIFAVDPRVAASVTQVLGRDFDVPMEAGFATFEVSPDEKRVVIPCSDGEVAIYNFATGETTKLMNKDLSGQKTRMLPSWKSNSEICYVQPRTAESTDRGIGVVTIWKDGQNHYLSESWPDELKDGWLQD